MLWCLSPLDDSRGKRLWCLLLLKIRDFTNFHAETSTVPGGGGVPATVTWCVWLVVCFNALRSLPTATMAKEQEKVDVGLKSARRQIQPSEYSSTGMYSRLLEAYLTHGIKKHSVERSVEFRGIPWNTIPPLFKVQDLYFT